jgi:glycosyltransferase involved in cell wall biosynthesis
MAKVDIIIPTYNRSNIISKTLESVQIQTFDDWHCWVAEDGESTAYISALEPFMQDGRFTYLPGKHTGSPATSRNRAMEHGNATYIAFLDDDDYWLPDKLEKQVDFMESNPDCVILGSQCYRRENDEDPQEKLPLYYNEFELEQVKYEDLVAKNPLMNSTVIIRRDVLKMAGLQNDKIDPPNALDYDHWLRIGVLGEIWRMPDPLIIYRDIPSESIRSIPDRRTYYLIISNVLKSALVGANIPSPLMLDRYRNQAEICRNRLIQIKTLYRELSPINRYKNKLLKKLKSVFKSATSFIFPRF